MSGRWAEFKARGVIIPHPESVWVAPDVCVDQIAPGVQLLPGTRLEGKDTWLGPGCRIGTEGPAMVRQSVLEGDVTIASGFCDGSLLLKGASLGPNAHIRPGCILEEQASTAHSVGLKHTVLFPFATLGSLINFCDCLLAGGTSRKNHSEVGSGFVHFNFTPQGDKATPSLFGDVVEGVFLRQPPIFLGGQGGAVGPVSVAYGTILAAGSILRKSVDEPGLLVRTSNPAKDLQLPYDVSRSSSPSLKLELNRKYLGQLAALRAWYDQIRSRFFRAPCIAAFASRLIQDMISERQKRVVDFHRINHLEYIPENWVIPEPTPAPVIPRIEEPDYHAWLDALPESDRIRQQNWLRECASS